MLVDTHLHVWNRALLDYPWLSDNRSLPHATPVPSLVIREQAGVTGVILVEAGARDRHAELAWMLDVMREQPCVLGVVAAADWTLGSLEPEVRRDGVVGVRLNVLGGRHQEHAAERLAGILASASDLALAVDVLCSPAELELLDRGLDMAASTTIVVIDHLARPPVGSMWGSTEAQRWAQDLERLERHPGVRIKLSGLTETGSTSYFTNAAVDIFGTARCLLGSDWPATSTTGYERSWSTSRALLGALWDDQLAWRTAHATYSLEM